MAARLKKELGIEVEKSWGGYGEFRVFVDGDEVINAGAWAALGVLPRSGKILAAVRERLGGSP